MSLLVGCESSGTVRDAFRARGIDAYSCDLLQDQSGSPYHIVGDVLDVIASRHWDALIAHPPCTYLCSSGLHWNKKRPEREQQTEFALQFVRALLNAPISHIAIENPVGRIGTAIRQADQYIQPYQFGHDASKRTGLWLKNLPKLRPTAFIEPRMVNNKPRWSNQTDSGQNRLGPSADRWQLRSKTYQGIAVAMANQWSATIRRNSLDKGGNQRII